MQMTKLNEQNLLEIIKKSGLVDIPQNVRVLDVESDVATVNGKEFPWARLIVTDSEKYNKLEQMDMLDNVIEIPVKVKHYRGQDLTSYQDREINTNAFDIAFKTRKANYGLGIVGLIFTVDINQL